LQVSQKVGEVLVPQRGVEVRPTADQVPSVVVQDAPSTATGDARKPSFGGHYCRENEQPVADVHAAPQLARAGEMQIHSQSI